MKRLLWIIPFVIVAAQTTQITPNQATFSIPVTTALKVTETNQTIPGTGSSSYSFTTSQCAYYLIFRNGLKQRNTSDFTVDVNGVVTAVANTVQGGDFVDLVCFGK